MFSFVGTIQQKNDVTKYTYDSTQCCSLIQVRSIILDEMAKHISYAH